MLRKIAGISGIMSQIVMLSVLLVVSNNSPWFSWTDGFISDFGFQGTLTGFFNTGIILVGLLSVVFSYGLRRNIHLNRTGMRGTTSLIIGSLGISTTGVLPKSLDTQHDMASLVSFIFLILGMLLIGSAIISASHVKLGLFSVGAGTLPIIFWLIPWEWSGGAIPQLFHFFSWWVWAIVFSLALLKSATAEVKNSVWSTGNDLLHNLR